MAKRPWKEEWQTFGDVFDQFTERNLFKLAGQHYFDGLESPLNIGKEANIFSAEKGGIKRIVKIYRLSTCDFNRMYDYLKYDPRFPAINRNKRKVIFSWAKREYRNLMKARDAGVRVPTPYTILSNILVMEFIGDEKAAPMLKDKHPKDPEKFLKDIVTQMRKLYKAGMVHGDLSAFNILNYNEKPVLIDMSQSTTLENTFAAEYLDRDIRNICNFFRKLGLDCSDAEIKKKIKK
ncbi:serine protein kinase RIO [Candidatus Woesearchaeota archaeon]|nr:serine protein kinase RIO [Candidatus Woesearchaeota archaeon]